MNIIQTIEGDLQAAGVWIKQEAGQVLTVAEQAADTALKDVWAVAKPVFLAAEPTAIAAVVEGVGAFLAKAEQDVLGGSLADLEDAFVMDAEQLGTELFAQAKGLGSTLLQVLIGLALKSLPAA